MTFPNPGDIRYLAIELWPVVKLKGYDKDFIRVIFLNQTEKSIFNCAVQTFDGVSFRCRLSELFDFTEVELAYYQID